MKKSREGFIYKRKGSATIMALIFMLFLSIAGGAWVMMLAQENKVAASDEMEQRARYAAEAGMKRAKAELRAKIEANEDINSDWDWLAKDREVNTTTDFNIVATGETLPNDGNIKSQVAKYGVYMGYVDPNDSGKMIDITKEARKGTVTYDIYAVGVYGDMRKVIKETSEPIELNPARNQSTDLEKLLSTSIGSRVDSSDRKHQIDGTGIRDYQNTFNESHPNINGNYWNAQQAAYEDKMVHRLTNYECTIIFNSDDGKRKYYDLDNANGSWKDWAPDNNLDTLTNLYLRPATAFYPDGTMADIQFVSNQDKIASVNTTYTACAVIINGVVYARINVTGGGANLRDTGTISIRFCIETGCDIQGNIAPLTLVVGGMRTATLQKVGIRKLNAGTAEERWETDDEWFIRQFMNNTVTGDGVTAHKDILHTAKPVAGYPTNDACPEISNSEYSYGDGKAFDRYAAARYQQVNYPE